MIKFKFNNEFFYKSAYNMTYDERWEHLCYVKKKLNSIYNKLHRMFKLKHYKPSTKLNKDITALIEKRNILEKELEQVYFNRLIERKKIAEENFLKQLDILEECQIDP